MCGIDTLADNNRLNRTFVLFPIRDNDIFGLENRAARFEWCGFMSDDFNSGPLAGKKTSSVIDPLRRETTTSSQTAEQPLEVIEVSGRIKWFDVA